MQQDMLETEQFKADFAASGAMELDELDEAEAEAKTDYDLAQLEARVQAARSWGA